MLKGVKQIYAVGMHYMDFFQLLQITDNNLLLMADSDKITYNFTFFHFTKVFLTCRLCTPEGKKG